MKPIMLIILTVGLHIFGCEENSLEENCLPYEGQFFDSGNLCSGIVIKVTNKDVNSLWDRGDGIFENVIGIQLDPTLDSVIINEKFYFDFRELKAEEIYPCPTLWTAPSRIVFITQISLEQCTSNRE